MQKLINLLKEAVAEEQRSNKRLNRKVKHLFQCFCETLLHLQSKEEVAEHLSALQEETMNEFIKEKERITEVLKDTGVLKEEDKSSIYPNELLIVDSLKSLSDKLEKDEISLQEYNELLFKLLPEQ